MERQVPEPTTRRLSLYLRVLADMEAGEVETTSSEQIARRCNLNPAQVRKDLAHFGGFGIRGVGYDVAGLRQAVAGILGLDRERPVLIVGAGNLGSALADYPGFNTGGFRIVALLDIDPAKIGTRTRRGAPVCPLEQLEDLVAKHGVEMAIIAVPAPAAPEVVDRLVAAGIRTVLNFAPVRPVVPDGVHVRHVDLKVELESLSFFLAEDEGDGEEEEDA